MRRIGQYSLAVLFVALIIELVLISPEEVKEKPAPTLNLGPGSATATATVAGAGATGTDETLAGTIIATDGTVSVPNPADIEQLMAGIHVIETRNEHKEWELWSDKAIGLKDKGALSLEKVKASFFSKNGVSFLVTGNSGVVQSQSKNMTIIGDVQTISSNGYVFKTTSMNYDSEHRILKSPAAVQVTGPSSVDGSSLLLVGQEMATDLEKGEVVISNDVKARRHMADDKNINVVSEKVTLSGNTKGMHFEGKVMIDMNGVKITGPSALFKYDTQSQLLESIELEGGVRVSDFDKWATSDRLKIDVAKNSYIFDGRPRVVQDNDEVRGGRIIFLDGGKKVKVQNARIKVSEETLQKDDPRFKE